MCESVRAGTCTHSFPTLQPHGTVARWAPLSMGFSRQGYWRGLPFPPPMGSSQPGDRTCVSWVSSRGRQILLHLGRHIYIHTNTHILSTGPLSDTWFEMFSPTCVLFLSFSQFSHLNHVYILIKPNWFIFTFGIIFKNCCLIQDHKSILPCFLLRVLQF